MPRFLILDDAVHRQATSLGTTVEDLQQVLQQYHGTAQNTFANWAGLGADAFQQFDTRFQDVSQGLVTSLGTIRTEVHAAGIDYDNNETAQQAAVDALPSLEGPLGLTGGTGPPGTDRDDGGFLDGVGDFFGGLAHPFREMWDSVWHLFTDPGEWLSQTWDGIYNSVAVWNWDTFVETWKETGKDFVAWDEWGENWPRALGITITNVGLTVLTGGVGWLAIRTLLRAARRGRGNGSGNGGNGQPPRQNNPGQGTPEQNRPQFTDQQPGPNLRRSTTVDSVDMRINSGHGYRHNHPNQGEDITSVMSRDQADAAVANDLARRVNAGETVVDAAGRRGHSTFTTQVNGYSVQYHAVRLPNGSYSISTYYIP